ncbi:integrin alpha-PS2-like [Phymastichus coffea]|uniref:integrin alpha-PS2-like n=1 Tax=Phymastichus coffea TaxID=108790 RepID=UPI00273A93F1|nr:integrin alpha-PS2-like [Phymastichus coffea]
MPGKQFSFFYIIALVLSHKHVFTFNVEVEDYAVYQGDSNSMFGYAVAEYRDQHGRGWVIVGAPLNQTRQLNIDKGGSVFRCDIAEDNRCFPIEFDKKGVDYVRSHKYASGIEPIDEKSGQWFGATIAASTEAGGPLLACAPKYHWFGYIKANWTVAGFKDVVGACWLTTLGNDVSTEYSPCRNNETAGHHRQGMCQAGSAAAITKDGKRLFIGAPGSWYWQGQLFTVESNVTLPFTPAGSGRTPYEQPRLLATKEGPAYEDNSYLGYSVAVGDFLGNKDSGVAVGVPRGADLNGKVLMFSSQLYNHQNITGEQMGSYFGYALAVADIDADGLDDIIISAPFYTPPDLAGVKIETGRIYVFYQKADPIKFSKFHTRDGQSNRGQFGLSLASLGDIDADGFGDFVVGEPYGGDENRGAVYIYRGSPEGVEEKYSQVIYSENLEQPVRTFGWSVAGGLDLDRNEYTDLVVGAYESNAAFYFRARPVIEMTAALVFSRNLISLTTHNCLLSDGFPAACADFKVCYMYVGKGAWPRHEFNVTITLDAKKKKSPRMFFLDYETTSVLTYPVTLSSGLQNCRQFRAYLAKQVRDKLTPLEAEMHIELQNNSTRAANHWKTRSPKSKLQAVLSPKNTKQTGSLNIQKNCGPDNICIPDLSVRIKRHPGEYVLNSGHALDLDVNIQNNGEDAFEASYYLFLPKGIDYVNVENSNYSKELIVQCTAPKDSNNNTLRCDIGNPLPANKNLDFKIRLQPVLFHGMKPNFELNMKVNSSNNERPNSIMDNIYRINVPVRVNTVLKLYGESKPKEIDFNWAKYVNTDFSKLNNLEKSPLVMHNYTIRNSGPSAILRTAVNLTWSAETLAGDILLYLFEQPEVTEGKVVCDSANADFLSIKQKLKDRLLSPQEFNSNDKLRNKRQAYSRESSHSPFCEGTRCVHLTCKVGQLQQNEEVFIAMKFLVNMTTLSNITKERLQLSSFMNATVTSQPFIGEPIEKVRESVEIGTTVQPLIPPPKPDVIDLWIVILAACAGMAILLLLMFLLYKCGFFKRNRPTPVHHDKQPLSSRPFLREEY